MEQLSIVETVNLLISKMKKRICNANYGLSLLTNSLFYLEHTRVYKIKQRRKWNHNIHVALKLPFYT